MEDKLKNVFEIVLEVNPSSINEDSSPDNIVTWDSMNHMNLIIAIEEEFNVKIMDDDAVDLLSYGKILSYLEGKK